MRKLGPVSLRWLKIIHIALVALFFGGILSSIALSLNLKLSSLNEVYVTYKSLIIISDNIVRYGAQGTLIVGIIYGLLTNWGFFKQKWVAVKWAIFIIQTIIGIFVVDKLMVANMTLLDVQKSTVLNDPAFIHNHILRQYIVIFQSILTILILCISVLKPWKGKAANS